MEPPSTVFLDFIASALLNQSALPALAVVLLLLSAIISGYEVAFYSLPGADLDRIREEKSHFSDRHILFLQQRPQRLLATILLSNNLVNILLILLSTLFVDALKDHFGGAGWLWFLIQTVAITSLLLLIGEITPKVYANHKQLRFLRLFTPIIRSLYVVFLPISFVLSRSTRFLFQRVNNQEDQTRITNQELRTAIDMTPEVDTSDEEKQILKALVNLNNIPVKAVLRSRVDVVAFDTALSNAEVLQRIAAEGYSRFPVYTDSLDNIEGILHIKDLMPLLKGTQNAKWTNFLRKPFFVPESKRISTLLNQFKERRLHMAIVSDEYGGTEGIITLQDILDEIFGEIKEQENKNRSVIRQIDEETYELQAQTSLLDLPRLFAIDSDFIESIKGENDTLGGLIVEHAGKLPQKGYELNLSPLQIKVLEVSPTRIENVLVTCEVLPEAETKEKE